MFDHRLENYLNKSIRKAFQSNSVSKKTRVFLNKELIKTESRIKSEQNLLNENSTLSSNLQVST